MTEVIKFGKKIFTASVVGSTMLWSVGVSALLPAVAIAAVCPTLAAGDMIKVSGFPAIYSVNKDMKVLYFPSGDEFKSWNVNESYGGYVTVTQACFDSLPVPSAYPGAVNYRAGSWVVKRPSSDQLYVVLPGNSLAKISVADAKLLYGNSFKAKVVADAFWPHYTMRGVDVAGAVHEGMLVSNAGKTWYVDAGNVLKEVTAAGMTANRFKSSFVHAVAAAALVGTSVGAVMDAAVPALANRTQDGALATPVPGPAPVVGGNLNVSLASDNPAATNLADGSAYNSVLKLSLSASSATQVTGITLTKTGLIANSNISGVSVWDAQGNRHGDVMTSLTSDGKVTVSFGTNPVLVAAGGSESLTVKVNIAAAANSGLVGFKVVAATDVVSNGTAGGSFPVEGNQMAIIDGNASLANVSTTAQSVGGAATQPASTASGNLNIGDVQKEVSKVRFTENSGNEDVVVSMMTFYFEGTVQDADLTNISVYAPDGSKLGSAAAISGRYATVNFTTSYTVPKSTNRDLTVKLDVVNGSTRNFRLHVQNDYDLLMKGATTGFYTLPSGFSDVSSTNGWFNMGSGNLTVNKHSLSPAGNVSAGSSNIVLAKFDVKAVGEKMEVRKMGLGVFSSVSVGSASKNLTGNVVVRDAADGTVYLTLAGSTASLYATGAQNNLSNYITINAGATKTLEVVGSVDSTATSAQKYTVQVGNFYAKRFSTVDYADNLPTSGNTSTAANQLTVNATALTCYKDTSMGNVTRSTGATTVIGQYICTAGSSEDVRLTNVTVDLNSTSMNLTALWQNLELWNGSTQLGTTLSTVVTSSNNFNFDLTVLANQTVTLQAKAYVLSSAPAGAASTTLSAMNYTGKSSGNSVSFTTDVNGQNVTVGNGSLTITAVSDASTISKIYGPAQTGVQLGKWKFAASNDDVTLSKLSLSSFYSGSKSSATTLGTFGGFSLYDGSALLASGQYVNGDVVFSGFSSTITMDSYKVFTLKANTNASGVITNNTTTAWQIKSDSNTDMEARSKAGALLTIADILGTTSAESGFASSTNYIFHDAYPTIASVSLGTALENSTNVKIFKFTVTNSGVRDLKLGTTTVSISASGLAASATATGTIGDWRLYEDNGSGGLGTYLANTSTVGYAAGAMTVIADYASVGYVTSGSLLLQFGAGNDQNTMLENFLISPGATRTFIVTADTSNILNAKTTGTVTISAKISGTTGWSGSAWNTGNLQYFYTPVGGSETAAITNSDSYDVTGASLSKTL